MLTQQCWAHKVQLPTAAEILQISQELNVRWFATVYHLWSFCNVLQKLFPPFFFTCLQTAASFLCSSFLFSLYWFFCKIMTQNCHISCPPAGVWLRYRRLLRSGQMLGDDERLQDEQVDLGFKSTRRISHIHQCQTSCKTNVCLCFQARSVWSGSSSGRFWPSTVQAFTHASQSESDSTSPPHWRMR